MTKYKNLAAGVPGKLDKTGEWARKELLGDWDQCDIPDKTFTQLLFLFKN